MIIFLWTVVICLLCIGVMALIIGLYFYHRAFASHSNKSDFITVNPHTKLKEEDIWYLEESKYEHVSIKNKDGLCLQGSILVQPKQTTWVILVHGYMGRLEDMISYAKHYHDAGYAVLLYDLRGHGKSEGKVIGFGVLDKKDVEEWCAYLCMEKGAKQFILHGVSMGAATVMMCCDHPNLPIKAIVEDCGYSSLKEELQVIVKKLVPHVPSMLLLGCLSLVLKQKAGYRIKDANPSLHIHHSHVPILLIHGERDDFIPIAMCEKLNKLCTSKHEMMLFKRGRHANSALLESDTYWETVFSFLDNCRTSL